MVNKETLTSEAYASYGAASKHKCSRHKSFLIALAVFGCVQGQPTSPSPSTRDGACEQHLLLDSTSLHPEARRALERCRNDSDENKQAGCIVLRGLELWTQGHQEIAVKNLHEALTMYDAAKDRWQAAGLHSSSVVLWPHPWSARSVSHVPSSTSLSWTDPNRELQECF